MQKSLIELIGDADLDTTFRVMSDFGTEVGDNFFLDELTLLRFRYNTIKKSNLTGTQPFETINTQLNQISQGLIDLIRSSEAISAENKLRQISELKVSIKSAVESASRKTIVVAEKFNSKTDYGEKHYLTYWYRNEFNPLSKVITQSTFDVLELQDKDDFEFQQQVIDIIRLVLKSYLNNSDEWLKSPDFIFEFKLFSKSEIRTALLLLSKAIAVDEGILKTDRIGLIEKTKILDSAIKLLADF